MFIVNFLGYNSIGNKEEVGNCRKVKDSPVTPIERTVNFYRADVKNGQAATTEDVRLWTRRVHYTVQVLTPQARHNERVL